MHFYNGGDLAACFSKNITDEVIREIAGKRPSKAVFCDNCFSGSPDKMNMGGLFRLLAPDTKVKVI